MAELTGQDFDSASSTIAEILEIAKDILDRGPDVGCTSIRIRALGVEVDATFGSILEPLALPQETKAPPAPPVVTPATVAFPGE